ncbi:MAG: RMD1 family protein [Rhizomicrobium sp.]
MTSQPNIAPRAARHRARAVLVGDRLAIDRTRHTDVVSTAPFCFRTGEGYVVAFRYGVLVLVGLQPAGEDYVIAQFADEIVQPAPMEEERVEFVLSPEEEDGPASGGVLRLKELTVPRILVFADILAKSVALARYEKEIATVFDTIEPTAKALSTSGRIPSARKALLQLIGSALLTQHRVSGRIAFAEKPDILWEHPEFERLYARLEDEYEIVERGTLINGKVGVIGAAAQTFTDMIDTARSTRLEILIVILILAELVIAALELFRR